MCLLSVPVLYFSNCFGCERCHRYWMLIQKIHQRDYQTNADICKSAKGKGIEIAIIEPYITVQDESDDDSE